MFTLFHITQDSICLFCRKSEEMSSLKPMQDKQWCTAKNASMKRKGLKTDQYSHATSIIQTSPAYEQYWYHS